MFNFFFWKKDIVVRKKALVIQGGGMRGIFLVGVLQSFCDRGYFPWKLIAGTSAGALTGVAYSTGQNYLARDAFLNKSLSDNLIKFSNLLNPKKHILNLDWLVDNIMKGDDPLNLNKLKKSCPVIIAATAVTDDESPYPVYFNSKKDDVFTALKASSALPFLYRGFVEYGGYNLLDGGLTDPIPYKKVLSLGYKESDITVILTRQRGHRKKEEAFWVKTILESYYKHSKYELFINELEKRYLSYNNIMDDLESNHKGITLIYPPDDFKVDRLSRDTATIMKGFQDGIKSGKKYLQSIGFMKSFPKI